MDRERRDEENRRMKRQKEKNIKKSPNPAVTLAQTHARNVSPINSRLSTVIRVLERNASGPLSECNCT
jgi:hypothetical protein